MTKDAKTDPVKNAAEKGLFYDPGRRFPIFTGAKGYEAMPFLSKEEKAVGVEMLWARWETADQKPEEYDVQVRNPSYVMQPDPLLWQEEMRTYAVLSRLVHGTAYDDESVEAMQDGSMHEKIQDPETLRRFRISMLMIAKIAQELEIDWVLELLGVGEPWGFLSKQQLILLNRPNSAVWSEEETLVLDFTAAVINRNMSDDLFARAKQTWGEKQLLRYAKWITFYVGWVMLTMIDVTDAERLGKIKA